LRQRVWEAEKAVDRLGQSRRNNLIFDGIHEDWRLNRADGTKNYRDIDQCDGN